MPASTLEESDEEMLARVQRDSFGYFREYSNRELGLICDSSAPGSHASIAAVGFALSSYPVAVDGGFMSRDEALALTLAALRFFHEADQSGSPTSVGYHGFFYHFIDMETGRRAGGCELSTIDTALLIAGMLAAAQYFERDTADERELRAKANAIYERVDWRWAQNGGEAVCLGWTPERGFLPSRWVGYSEALILYALALGSPTHPIDPAAYAAWLSGYRWKRLYGHAHVYAGPLFIHQYSHLWIDFRGIRDDYMRARGIDYFENSRRATYVQWEYARRNPKRFTHYHQLCWGLTAGDGPGPARQRSGGRSRRFFGYRARGAPFGPDDGTVSPWASVASLPFAPELVLPTLRYFSALKAASDCRFGLCASFNELFQVETSDEGWVSPWHFGINQGPIVLMIANHRDGLIWRLMRGCAPLVRGLRRAGFSGGWLDGE